MISGPKRPIKQPLGWVPRISQGSAGLQTQENCHQPSVPLFPCCGPHLHFLRPHLCLTSLPVTSAATLLGVYTLITIQCFTDRKTSTQKVQRFNRLPSPCSFHGSSTSYIQFKGETGFPMIAFYSLSDKIDYINHNGFSICLGRQEAQS